MSYKVLDLEKEKERRSKISRALKGHAVSEMERQRRRGFMLEKKIKLGYINSIETRQKMSNIKRKSPTNYWLGKKRSEEDKEKIRQAHLGKEHTKETKIKMSESKHGKSSHFWKGGITKENALIRSGIKFRLWRKAVFERDDYTCQKYRIKGGDIHPHHIQNFAEYPKLRFATDNGITLSNKAHKEFHKEYGLRNNSRKQLEEFLKE